jgi:hypothetical protein
MQGSPTISTSLLCLDQAWIAQRVTLTSIRNGTGHRCCHCDTAPYIALDHLPSNSLDGEEHA